MARRDVGRARAPAVLLWVLSFGLAVILLCGVAIGNGGPLYYPDTSTYLIDATRFLHLEAPYAVRPIFYGLAIWPFHWGTFFALVLVLQALIVAHLLLLTARACDVPLNPFGFFALILALVVITPVSFYVSHMLPDIFVAAAILALFPLGFCLETIGRAEAWYLLLLAAAATTFHLTAIPVGLAIFAVSVVCALLTRGRRITSLLVLAPVMLGLVLVLAFSVAVFQKLTLSPKGPPHLLARVLADGPGRDFLRATCPQRGFALCRYQDRLNSVEDDFMWRFLPSIPPADGYRIKAEANQVVSGTVAMFPLVVVEHMLLNTWRQLVTFDTQTGVTRAQWDEFQRSGSELARSLSHSLQSEGEIDSPALATVNAFHAGIVWLSFVTSLVMAGLAWRRQLFRPTMFIVTVLTALLANAFVCGALGGVFGRYQGRIVWLLPLSVIVAGLALLRSRSTGMQRRPWHHGIASRSGGQSPNFVKSSHRTVCARPSQRSWPPIIGLIETFWRWSRGVCAGNLRSPRAPCAGAIAHRRS